MRNIMLCGLLALAGFSEVAPPENVEKSVLTRICVECPRCGHKWCTQVQPRDGQPADAEVSEQPHRLPRHPWLGRSIFHNRRFKQG